MTYVKEKFQDLNYGKNMIKVKQRLNVYFLLLLLNQICKYTALDDGYMES